MLCDEKIEPLRKGCMKLWRTCFNDTKEFIRLYFSRKYSDENTVAEFFHGNLVSALQMLPYTMSWNGSVVPISYVSGAATLPQFHNMGKMRQVLTEAFLRMYDQKFLFSILIPQEDWLYDYYARKGYAAVCRRTTTEYLPVGAKIHPSVEILTSLPDKRIREAIHDCLSRMMLQRAVCVQHDMEDVDIIIRDHFLSEGRLYLHRENRAINGVAFVLPDYPSDFRVSELLYDTPATRTALLETIAAQEGCATIPCTIPPIKGHSLRHGMLRIINALEGLKKYATTHPTLSVSIQLTDDCLPVNTGYYRIARGTATRDTCISSPDLILDITELAYRLFKQNPPFVSLMLE